MKIKGWFSVHALLVTGAATYLSFFGGPFRFIDGRLDETSLAHLSSTRASRASPEEVADEYLHGLLHPSDRPKREELEISVSNRNAAEAVATLINRHVQDDSISATCDRVTLRLHNSRWKPVPHQLAWQGRGLIGWSTKPAG